MRLCLAKDGRAIEGDTRADLVSQAAHVELDFNNYTMKIDGELDGISYNKSDYTPEEFVREAMARAVVLLERRGWTLYERRE